MGSKSNKLIIVSNRLPVSVKKVDGKLHYSQSSGGLATGLSSVNEKEKGLWLGWPGIAAEDLTRDEIKQATAELKKRNCVPVFLSQKEIDEYYSGYSNEVIWPLFHYTYDRSSYDSRFVQTYRDVNQKFCKEIIKHVSEQTKVWVHDYHLMLLPKMIRDRSPETKIGFFLHTPFSSFEIFRLIPQREELLEGLLGADLIGFHTYDYVRHFMSSVLRILGYESTDGGQIQLGDRHVQIDVFPIGIDYQKFVKATKKRAIKNKVAQTKRMDGSTKVILSFDRADYSKGIPERLRAYERFLEDNPDFHGSVTMRVIVAPSRTDVEAYQKLQEEIEVLVSQINGSYSTLDWAPISYIARDLDFEDVVAAFCSSDVLLVTPLRDGMNLMAKEFIASKQKDPGVLILSEMAGAATELLEAILVNPNNVGQVSRAIKTALEMDKDEQLVRFERMQKRISEYTIFKWAEDFMEQLKTVSKQPESSAKVVDAAVEKEIIEKYKKAKNRLLLLDYDGTLKTFVDTPDAEAASPSKKLVGILKKLNSKKTEVFIISGRPKGALMKWFRNTPISLVAEHGAWIREVTSWVKNAKPSARWKSKVQPILQKYTERTPGSVFEVKEFAFVWHYRNVNPGLAYSRKEELKMELETALNGHGRDIGIFEGQKILEIKPRSMQKGQVVSKLLSEKEYDFVLVAGDDYTDEDMFSVMPDSAFSIKVGIGNTEARYYINSVQDVQNLIEKLSKIK